MFEDEELLEYLMIHPEEAHLYYSREELQQFFDLYFEENDDWDECY